MREYEAMLILPAEADESVVSTAVERITNVVAAHGGAVSNIDRWGRRRFAYEMQRMAEGYYVVVGFTAEPVAQPELERTLNLADEVIRHKVLLLPEKRASRADRTSARAETRRRAATERTGANEETASPAPA